MTDIPAVLTGTNADLIKATADLGYLSDDDMVVDLTCGRGVWWRLWEPRSLVKVRPPTDFRRTPLGSDQFDVVAFDPPYRLNGTPDRGDFDERYGIDVPMKWQDKHKLIRDGIDEGLRLLKPGGRLLVKCQDQVCSGKVRWQTHEFTAHAEDVHWEPRTRTGDSLDLVECRRARLVDSLLLLGFVKPQPTGRDQVHFRRNYSTLLILEKS